MNAATVENPVLAEIATWEKRLGFEQAHRWALGAVLRELSGKDGRPAYTHERHRNAMMHYYWWGKPYGPGVEPMDAFGDAVREAFPTPGQPPAWWRPKDLPASP